MRERDELANLDAPRLRAGRPITKEAPVEDRLLDEELEHAAGYDVARLLQGARSR